MEEVGIKKAYWKDYLHGSVILMCGYCHCMIWNEMDTEKIDGKECHYLCKKEIIREKTW